jgi:hypothetical protein
VPLTITTVAVTQIPEETSLTAASTTAFSPPAGSMVVVTATWLCYTNTTGITFTCKDSLGNVYTVGPQTGDEYGISYSMIFTYQYATAPGSITVSITASKTSDDAVVMIAPEIIAGQAPSQVGAASLATYSTASGTSIEESVTTTENGSYVYIAAGGSANAASTATAEAGTTTISQYEEFAASFSAIGRSTSTTGTPGATSFGWTLSQTAAYGYSFVALEILPLSASPGAASLNGLGVIGIAGTFAAVGTASLSGSGAITPNLSLGLVSALAGTGTLAVSGWTIGPSTALNGSGTLAGLGGVAGTLLQSVALVGVGTLGATETEIDVSQVPLTGSGTFSGMAIVRVAAAGGLTGSGVLGGTAGETNAFSGHGTITAAGYYINTSTAALNGAGTIAPTGVYINTSTAPLSGVGVIGSSAFQLSGVSALSGYGTISSATYVAGSPYDIFGELTVADSLIIADQIEVLGGGVPSTIPECQGAQFRLQPGWSGGSPQPTVDITATLALDGEVPIGRRASNRVITLPLAITAPNRVALIAAREVLMRAIDQPVWNLRWTRSGSQLPTIYDCFRANPTVITNILPLETSGITAMVTISFPAKPYGRSDVPVIVDFQSPLIGIEAPPTAIVMDNFATVSAVQWIQSTNCAVGPYTACYCPQNSPANNPTGVGVPAVFSRTGLSINLAQGWSATAQGTGSNNYIQLTAAGAVNCAVGQQFQLWSGGVLLQSQIFTITAISPAVGGYVNVYFSPNASATTVSGDVATQTGPPNLSGITFWAGFGATIPTYYNYWCKRGGPVRFSMVLTDNMSNQITFSIVNPSVKGSNSAANPKWTKLKLAIPYVPGFNYSNVTAYTLTITNRATGDLWYTQVYLDALTAVPPSTPAPSPQRGIVYDLAGMVGSARAPIGLQVQQPITGVETYTEYTKFYGNPGGGQWVAPPGVTTVAVLMGGPGGGSDFGVDGSGGSGGGGTAYLASIAVTPGKAYNFYIGYGGFNGVSGNNTTFTGDSVTLTAYAGQSATSPSGANGGIAGVGGYAGGKGGNATASTTGGGGGGGSAGGSSGVGIAGNNASGGVGGAQTSDPSGPGGPGGRGGTYGYGNGVTPPGYGGGSGGSPGGASGYEYPGACGWIQLTYLQPSAMSTLIAHRPSYDGPDSLCPFVSPNINDVPNGSIQYPVTSLVPSLNARFGGTYTVVAVNYAWNNPSASRNIFVTVTQWQQPNGVSLAQSTTPLAVVPSTLVGPFVILGELTLPSRELPHDNLAAFYTVSITDSNTSDQFIDILFLDTMGSTVILQCTTPYTNFFLDEPIDSRDIGYILGSQFDRSNAVSVLDQATSISGGPLSIEPYGNQQLLLYAFEGAPSAEMVYYPTWYQDRLS